MKTPTVDCPVCGKPTRPTKTGKVGPHADPNNRGWVMKACVGVGQIPEPQPTEGEAA